MYEKDLQFYLEVIFAIFSGAFSCCLLQSFIASELFQTGRSD